MARTTKSLNNTEVIHAKPKDKEYSLMDGEGLKLRVKPNGSKLWIFNYYRPHTKKRANISFGGYPTITLAAARGMRKEARELLAQDIDPKDHKTEQTQKHQQAHSATLEYIATQWLEVKRADVSSDHADDIWRSLELHVFPSLGKQPIHKLTAPNAIATLKPIASKGSLETVKRLCQRINEIMIYAVNAGVITSNPLSGIAKVFKTPPKVHQLTIKPEKLPHLMSTLNTASIKLTTRCLIEWQLHTMVRPGEAAGTRWEEIDEVNKLWLIPAERMKKKKPHTIPLSPQALSLLEVMRPISGGREHIFPSDRVPSKHIHVQTANMALKRMGFGGLLVAHGMRSIASTTLNEQGFDSDIIESALAHVGDNEVRNAYNRADYLERRKAMMAWWSQHIENAAAGNMGLATGTKTLTAVN